jgi:DNA-binding response OmpR family regulator
MLEKEGYAVDVAPCIADARAALAAKAYNLLILDVMLPDGDGFSFCAEVRTGGNNIPILFLTACDYEIQVVRGLDAGADDYVTKPYNPTILLLRISAVLKRSAKTSSNTQMYHDAEVSSVKGSLTRNGNEQILTKNEMIIFQVMLDRIGEIVTRDELMTALWDNDEFVNDNALSVNISRLRGKLSDLGFTEAIETRKKQGYVLK